VEREVEEEVEEREASVEHRWNVEGGGGRIKGRRGRVEGEDEGRGGRKGRHTW
jgi:hypothetical protein